MLRYNSILADGKAEQIIEAVLATKPDMTLVESEEQVIQSHNYLETLDGVTTEYESSFAWSPESYSSQTWRVVVAELEERGFKLKHLFRNGHIIWVE